MDLSSQVLNILQENRGEAVSGSIIASKTGVTRNSIWKAVSKLKEKGYVIEAVTNKGYRLVSQGMLSTLS